MGFSSTRSPNPLTCASRFFSLCIFLSVTCICACVINACIREWGKVRFDVQMERARELSPAPAPPWMGRQIFQQKITNNKDQRTRLRAVRARENNNKEVFTRPRMKLGDFQERGPRAKRIKSIRASASFFFFLFFLNSPNALARLRSNFSAKDYQQQRPKEQGCARSALVKTTTKRSLHVHE